MQGIILNAYVNTHLLKEKFTLLEKLVAQYMSWPQDYLTINWVHIDHKYQ